MIGKRYGMLTVVERVKNPNPKDKSRRWLCRCDCGGTIEATTKRLNSGVPYHCGCLRSPDLSGQVFGKVTVLRRAEEHGLRGSQKRVLWECQCECGNIIYKYIDTLKNDDITMCQECANKINPSKARDKAGFVEGTQISRIRSTKPPTTNKSGVRGVSYYEKLGKWRAGIKFKGKSINLGYYDNLADAAAARKRGEEEIFGAFLEEQEKTAK